MRMICGKTYDDLNEAAWFWVFHLHAPQSIVLYDCQYRHVQILQAKTSFECDGQLDMIRLADAAVERQQLARYTAAGF